MTTLKYVLTLFFYLTLLYHTFPQSSNKEQSGKKSGSKTFNGSSVGTKKPINTGDCPVKVPIKPDGYEVVTPAFIPQAKANLVRSSTTMQFDQVFIKDISLNVPAFKQFKNNRTDFTDNGEQEFREISNKIKQFLNTDIKGKNVVLKITGSASQIPTSYDPTKPGNNLKLDGSSIPGKTSIQNNKLLAKARADELAKKLKHLFPTITIITPKIEEIKLGDTKWTLDMQQKLSKAISKKDRVEMDKIFEPFQKDQWVRVESTDRTTKTIQPEALKMYMVSTTPSLHTKIDNKEQTVKTIFIVSKNTYDKVGFSKSFGTVAERDRFLRKLNLKIHHWDKDSVQRWYLLEGGNETKAFNTSDSTKKIIDLYKVGVIDQLDEALLKKYVLAELENKYK